jgi:tetratricopeptide (TPR) repeat protein
MIGRLKLVVLASAAALVMAPTLSPAGHAAAQQESGRFRVLIPSLFPLQGANDNFGKDVAKELREAMSSLPTHAPVEEDEIKDNLKRFKLKMEELDCTKTRQLGAQMNVQVALCASYTESGDDRTLQDIKFIDLGSSQEFDVEGFTTHKDRKQEAAQQIVQAFDTYVQQIRFRQFCFEYTQSSDWAGAMRNCEQALEMNPGDVGAMYQRAYVLWKTDQLEEALTQLESVLETDPYHEEGLQLAGFLATTLGRKDQGRQYYGTYLEVNPGAIAVRRNIAYDMLQAGDPEGALLLIEEGIGTEEPSPELLSDLGNYAFEAARQAMPEGVQQGSEDVELPPEVAALYRKAIDAYAKLYAQRGDSMSVGELRNVVLGHVQLGELDQAEQFANQALETHPEEASLWSVYSTVLERQDKIDEAARALQRIESIDPEYANLYVRQASLYMRAGQRDQALPLFKRAVERGQDGTTVARIIFGDAHSKGINPPQKNYPYALAGIEAAKEFEVNPETKSMLDFWHGYTLFQMGIATQEPQTLESARRSLPMFQRALQLFEGGRQYALTQTSINLGQFLQAANTYIEIQDAIIKRGR